MSLKTNSITLFLGLKNFFRQNNALHLKKICYTVMFLYVNTVSDKVIRHLLTFV